jgi:hypothetical protein
MLALAFMSLPTAEYLVAILVFTAAWPLEIGDAFVVTTATAGEDCDHQADPKRHREDSAKYQRGGSVAAETDKGASSPSRDEEQGRYGNGSGHYFQED